MVDAMHMEGGLILNSYTGCGYPWSSLPSRPL